MKRLNRYLLSEIVPLLVTGLAVIVLLLILGALQDVIAPLLAKGARPALVARLVALQLPEALGRGLPIALLFATLLGLSRLASDSEIKALGASGVSPLRLAGPVLALGVLVSGLSFAVNEGVVTRSKVRALEVQRELVLDNPRVAELAQGQEKQGLILRDAYGRAIAISQVAPGGELRGLSIVTLQAGGIPREMITAQRGHLRPGSNVLELYNGQRVSYQGSERPSTVLHFERGELPVQDLQASFGTGGDLKPIYLPLRILRARAATPQAAPQDVTALQRKFAEPLAALCMAFFAISLALYSFRTGLNVGLVWVLLLTFLYYATWSVFRVMGEQGALPGWIAAWTPNILYLLAGAVLLALARR